MSTRYSRSLSPVVQESSFTFDLTPRSKIQAMLAALDSDSDKENPPKPQWRKVAPSINPTNVAPPNGQPRQHPTDSSSDADSDITRPRKGTFAARMQAGFEATNRPDKSDDISRLAEHRESEEASIREQQLQQATTDRPELFTPDPSPIKQRAWPSHSPGLFVSPEPSRQSQTPPIGDDASQPGHGSSSKPINRLQALVARRRQELAAKEKENQQIFSEESSDHEKSSSLSPEKPRQKKEKAKKMRLAQRSESEGEQEASRLMTQASRPTRKASKKAIEEMNRETQRLSRNMQLTHEARTKIKFTRQALFKNFNFRQTPSNADQVNDPHSSNPSSVNPSSDVESRCDQDTPPSSPPSQGTKSPKPLSDAFRLPRAAQLQGIADELEVSAEDNDSDELLDLSELLSQRREKAESSAQVRPKPAVNPIDNDGQTVKRTSARRFAKSAFKQPVCTDSDDDLEIIAAPKPSRLAIFNALPALKTKESHSLHALRALAHLNESDKQRAKNKNSMTTNELQAVLHRRAREQALQERDEKIQRLREKGVIVQTAEEKEREQMQLESMLEKARKEAGELAKKEKDVAKREGNEDSNMLDSEDDEDYRASDEEELDDLSGSDEEEDEDGEDKEDPSANGPVGEPKAMHPFFDQLAVEDADVEEEEHEDDLAEGDEGEASAPASDDDASIDDEIHASNVPKHTNVMKRRNIIVSDDEVDDDVSFRPSGAANVAVPTTPTTSPIPSSPAANVFGFFAAKPAALGLSQVFAGTMAEEQCQSFDPETETLDGQQDSMAFLRALPPATLPDYGDCLPVHSPALKLVADSQENQTPTRRNGYSQFSGPVNFDMETQQVETQITDAPEPTQDGGFKIGDSQPAILDASYETVATVILGSPSVETPVRKIRGRLQRRSETLVSLTVANDEVEEDFAAASADGGSEMVNAFVRMREARQKAERTEAFNKKQSKAKEMFEEQAEESEDEYAGLGGASDDESQGELDEETRRMIDDHGKEVTNERDIAAYYAEKERMEDEKNIEKLYKDVINGGLRRKRGAQDDLFDSDDEDEAAARRRAAKQRDFAKMRKALLADEKIGKIAANPKQAAFLHAIEDRDEFEELDFLDGREESFTIAIPDSQVAAESQQDSSSTITNGTGHKRKHVDSADDASAMPPPAHSRKTKRTKISRPTSLADIRNTLSEIIGQPDSILESQAIDNMSDHSETEAEHSSLRRGTSRGQENYLYDSPRSYLSSPPPEPLPPNPRRTQATATRNLAIDRIALRKQASSLSNARAATETGQTRLAFLNTSASSFTSKVPSLLRRATTNSSVDSMSNSSSGYSTAAAPGGAIGGLGGKENIKRGGTAKSSVNYYVREMERKAKLERVEKERSEGRLRVGKMRRDAFAGKSGSRGGALGGLLGGLFE